MVLELLGVLEVLDDQERRPRAIVRSSHTTVCLRRPVCAARTASAIVRLLPIRTIVLVPPRTTFNSRLASDQARGYQMR
jgi:hypothetical protein